MVLVDTMLLPDIVSPRTCLIFVVLLAFVILGETAEDGRLDIKFGFDLRQGSNGAPSLRIRQFEGSSNISRRADVDSNESGKRPKARPSSSDSDSDEPMKKDSSKEKGKSDESESESEDDDDSSATERARSTRGLKAEDYEPEEKNPKIHARFNKHASGENSSFRRRRRRSIGRQEIVDVLKFVF